MSPERPKKWNSAEHIPELIVLSNDENIPDALCVELARRSRPTPNDHSQKTDDRVFHRIFNEEQKLSRGWNEGIAQLSIILVEIVGEMTWGEGPRNRHPVYD